MMSTQLKVQKDKRVPNHLLLTFLRSIFYYLHVVRAFFVFNFLATLYLWWREKISNEYVVGSRTNLQHSTERDQQRSIAILSSEINSTSLNLSSSEEDP